MSSVTIKNLVKNYGSVAAVRGIDLEVNEGEFIALLGPSGCGKTTTLRCIAGLEDITSGEIQLGDRVVSATGFSMPTEKREIGMVFQSYAIWPHMTVFDNVAFGLKIKWTPKAEIQRRVHEALELVGLKSLVDRGVSQLSGGQQQRVALARSFVLEPGVLLFDEPLSNLDAKLREKMRFELRRLQTRLGTTSIYVTHDQQEAMVVADRIVMMNDGRIEQIGSPTDIYRRPRTRFGAEFVGLANFLPGKVASVGTASTVVLDGDLILKCALVADLGVETAADAMIRPENLSLSATRPAEENCFEAQITTVYYLGNMADIYLESGPLSLRVQASPPGDWQPGQKVWVRVQPEDVVLLPGAEASRGPVESHSAKSV